MQPGQCDLNEFELAILLHLCEKHCSLRPFIDHLRVLSREFTGVGSYTKLRSLHSGMELGEQKMMLDTSIYLPSVPSGLGAMLFCKNGVPNILEIYTYGDEHWDGIFDGFQIVCKN